MTNEDYQSKMTCIYVFIIMSVSRYCGQLVISTFGISISGLRIAGGMIVGIIGFRMLSPQQPSHKTLEADEKKKEISNNIAFVPLAMPSTAGPRTIAMIISMSSTVKSGGYNVSTWVVYASSIPLLLCIILWFCIRSAGSIMRFMEKVALKPLRELCAFY